MKGNVRNYFPGGNTSKGFYSYYIIYRISARRVVENDNFVGLFNIEKYSELEEVVDEILKDKCSYLPILKQCNLKRMDFCVNAELDNQEQLETAMIELIENPDLAEKLAKNAIELNDSLELNKIMNQWIHFIKKTTAEKH